MRVVLSLLLIHSTGTDLSHQIALITSYVKQGFAGKYCVVYIQYRDSLSSGEASNIEIWRETRFDSGKLGRKAFLT